MVNEWVVMGHTDKEVKQHSLSTTQFLWAQALEGKLTDVKIHLDCGRVFHAHRSVLACRSKVFQGMFESDMEESRTGKIMIRDFSGAAFGEFLSFIYTSSTSKAADGAELWSLADLYEVEGLKEFLLSSLNQDSVLGAVRFASTSACPVAREALRSACAEVGRKSLASISQESLVGVSVKECQLLMSHSCGALEKFKFAERWHCANRDRGVGEDSAEVGDSGEGVEQLLDMVDLRMVSTADLLALVKPSMLISPERLNLLYERRLRSMEWARQKFEHIKSIGKLGHGEREFNRPVGVALTDSGKVVVTDQENCRIQILGLNDSSIFRFGSRGDGFGRFLNPVAVSVDREGLYVCDHDRHEVQVFRQDGTFIRVFGGEGSEKGRLMNPRDSAISRDGNLVVCDKGNNRMQIFKPDGTPLFSFGGTGEFEGQFKDPCGVAVSPSSNIVVADSGNARIQVFDRDGGFLHSFGNRGEGPGQFQSPDGIAVSDHGDIVVSDWRLHRISIFRDDGEFVQAFGKEGSGDGEFKGPAGVTVSRSGSVVVADQLHHRVHVWGRL